MHKLNTMKITYTNLQLTGQRHYTLLKEYNYNLDYVLLIAYCVFIGFELSITVI